MIDQRKPLVVVDIQPEWHYAAKMEIDMELFIETLKNHEARVYYIFVGSDLTDDEECDVRMMLNSYGIDEEIIAHMKFIEKDYGWIRDEMEKDEDAIKKKLDSGGGDYIIDLLDTIPNDVYICGGGRHECLAEVMHTLDYMGRDYEEIESFIY